MKQTQWALPKNLLQDSVSIMRPHGAKNNEGLALWFGTEDGATVTVSHIVEAVGPGFFTTPLYMSLSLRAMAKLTDLAEELDAYLVGQIHSHPGMFVDLSRLDKKHGIRIPNYLSLVCPHYAQKDIRDFNECGVHVYEQRDYRRLPSLEIQRRLVTTAQSARVLRCEVPA